MTRDGSFYFLRWTRETIGDNSGNVSSLKSLGSLNYRENPLSFDRNVLSDLNTLVNNNKSTTGTRNCIL